MTVNLKFAQTEYMNFSTALVNFKRLMQQKSKSSFSSQELAIIEQVHTILKDCSQSIDALPIHNHADIKALLDFAVEFLISSKTLVESTNASLLEVLGRSIPVQLKRHSAFIHLHNTIAAMDAHIKSKSIRDPNDVVKEAWHNCITACMAGAAYTPMNMSCNAFSGKQLERGLQFSANPSADLRPTRGYCYGAVMTWARSLALARVSNFIALKGHAIYLQTHQASLSYADRFFRFKLNTYRLWRVHHELDIHRISSQLFTMISEQHIYEVGLGMMHNGGETVGHSIGIRQILGQESNEIFDPNLGLYSMQGLARASMMLASILNWYNKAGRLSLVDIEIRSCTLTNSCEFSVTGKNKPHPLEPSTLPKPRPGTSFKALTDESAIMKLFTQQALLDEYPEQTEASYFASQSINNIILQLSEGLQSTLQRRKILALEELQGYLARAPKAAKYQRRVIFQWAGQYSRVDAKSNIALLASHRDWHLPGQRTNSVKMLYQCYDDLEHSQKLEQNSAQTNQSSPV